MYESSLNERSSDFDWPLLAAAAGLMFVGAAFIFSATGGNSSMISWYRQMWVHQIIWYAIGLTAAVGLLAADYSRLTRWSALFYWAAIVLLVAVFVVGSEHHGGKRWITLGIFGLQPSEFAKIAFILLMANFLSRPKEELRLPKVFWTALCYTMLPFVLILKEPDLGSAVVFLAISMAMMFVAGVPARMLAMLGGGTAMVGALVVVLILFAPARLTMGVLQYQKTRLQTYFGRNKRSA